MELKFNFEKAAEELFPKLHPVEKVKTFIEEKIQYHKSLLGTIINQLELIILEYQREIYKTENRASVYLELEEKYQVKTVESIIEKLWRAKNAKGESGKYTVDDFHETMEDIIRFRILCNYLCDADDMAKILPGKMEEMGYKMVGEPKNFINKEPAERKKGHRAIHLIFQAEFNRRIYRFEVQVMTLLQNAWDRKDHSIVYEYQRIGKEVPLKLKMRSYAMSEMLYVADDYFNELLLGNKNGRGVS